jgi:hypothetical protein
METYTPYNVPDNNIFEVWWDGVGNCIDPGNGTGSMVEVRLSDPRRGAKSMNYHYDNDGMVPNPCNSNIEEPRAKYSKAKANLADLPSGIGSDWTVAGVKALVLQFYGTTGNAIESMWVELIDGAGGNETVTYGDYADENPADINEASWHEWNIDLQDFADGGVNLSAVKSIAIGFGDPAATQPGGSGTVYFDDVGLYPARCVLSRRSADFTKVDYVNDCRVDYKELDRMSEQWLTGKEPEVAFAPFGAWSHADIGSTATPGNFVDNGNGSYDVTGSGADIWGTADAFHYVHRPLTGDGQITVNVVSIGGTSTNEWQKAGVMIREGLTPGSRNVMMLMSAGGASANFGGGDAFQWRPVADAASSSSHVVCDNIEVLPPNCVRLVRAGNTFRGFVYVSGQWIQEGPTVTIDMPETVYIGLAVTSHDNATGIYTTARFNSVCDSSLGGPDLTADDLINFKDYTTLLSRWLDEGLYP